MTGQTKVVSGFSRWRIPTAERWPLLARLLMGTYGGSSRAIAAITITLLLVLLYFVDFLTKGEYGIRPLFGMLVLAAFAILRLQGIWWLLGVIAGYIFMSFNNGFHPSVNTVLVDDIAAVVAFGIIGLLSAWLGDSLWAIKLAQESVTRDLRLAGDLQHQIVSPGARFSWIIAEGRLRPTGEVGGDLYLISPVAEDTLFFAIGDVQGKGVTAALVMAHVSALLLELIRQIRSPGELLAETNKRLLEAKTAMVTAFVGFASRSGEGKISVLFAKAGHENGLVIKQAGYNVELSASGLPLGVLSGEYEERTVILDPGDRLLLFTDGVTDARDASLESFGAARLANRAAALAKKVTHSEVSTWLSQILRAVDEYRGIGEQEDDMAVLGVVASPTANG